MFDWELLQCPEHQRIGFYSVRLVLALLADLRSASCHTSQRLESGTHHRKLVCKGKVSRELSVSGCLLCPCMGAGRFLESFQSSVPLTAPTFSPEGQWERNPPPHHRTVSRQYAVACWYSCHKSGSQRETTVNGVH